MRKCKKIKKLIKWKALSQRRVSSDWRRGGGVHMSLCKHLTGVACMNFGHTITAGGPCRNKGVGCLRLTEPEEVTRMEDVEDADRATHHMRTIVAIVLCL